VPGEEGVDGTKILVKGSPGVNPDAPLLWTHLSAVDALCLPSPFAPGAPESPTEVLLRPFKRFLLRDAGRKAAGRVWSG